MKNKKEMGKKITKNECLFLIVNLVLSIVAIGFLIGITAERVGAADPVITQTPLGPPGTGARGPTVTTPLLVDKPPAPDLGSGSVGAAQKAVSDVPVPTGGGGAASLSMDRYPDYLTSVGGPDKVGNAGVPSYEDWLAKNGGSKPTGTTPGATQTENQGFLKGLLTPKPGVGGLLQGAGFAMTVYALLGWILPALGVAKETTQAIQYGAASGIFAYYAVNAFGAPGGFTPSTGLVSAAPWIGIGVGLAVFLLTYKKTSYKIVTFECLPWEAPIGGADCSKCDDSLHRCSEYRCKSLGQACEIANKGTDKEFCYWKNPKDVTSPIIAPRIDVLTKGYDYGTLTPRPPGGGTEIIKKGTKHGCIAAFSPITFGIETNKPAQCKVDYNKNATYDQMQYYLGENNLYDYNHSQTMNLPSNTTILEVAKSQNDSSSITASGGSGTTGLEMVNNGRYTLFVRCKSANGYWNIDPYEIKFCVDAGPDTSPPEIVDTSIKNGEPVQSGIDKVPIILYTNEPANCKWSFQNEKFSDMKNDLECAQDVWDQQSNMLYACSGELTEIKDRTNMTFYFSCEDQPWLAADKRNKMSVNYKLTLQGTQPLTIREKSVKPNNETITGSTTTTNVTIELETENGYKEGEAECYYSVGNADNYVPFFETNSNLHRQRQDLTAGDYTYFIKCVDRGGNVASATTKFTVYIDKQPPKVIRVLYDADRLKLITDEDAQCVYTNSESIKCNYNPEDENAIQMEHETADNLREHLATWQLKQTYYVKCRDKNDARPNPTECTMIIKPVNIISSTDVPENLSEEE
ncbi:MAG: hypothetical protein WC796_00480 [Candidatus Pacearchaeota archaeon]|jgi:hypothetical protein